MAEPVSTREEPTAPLSLSRASRSARTLPLVNVGEALTRYGLPALVIAVFLAIWQYVPQWLRIPAYELPNLSATWAGLQADWGDIGTALMITLQDALAGFVLGNVLAILGATIFSYSRTVERAFYPLAILAQTIPIIVYAPLFVILFFKTPLLTNAPEAASVVGVTVLITFFPTLVNMNAGFKTIDPRIHELLRLLNASRTQIFLKLRFPSAIPFLFSSLKITSTLAFVGAIVGEYMVGGGFNPIGVALSRMGLQSVFGFATNPVNASGVGLQLQLFYSRLDKPGIFADVFSVSLLSILFFGLMVLLERVFVPWQKQQ